MSSKIVFGVALALVPLSLKKSKIERLAKSRESRCLDVSTAAMLARGDTKVRGLFVKGVVVPHVAAYETHQRF
jgi:hypothetical protein